MSVNVPLYTLELTTYQSTPSYTSTENIPITGQTKIRSLITRTLIINVKMYLEKYSSTIPIISIGEISITPKAWGYLINLALKNRINIPEIIRSFKHLTSLLKEHEYEAKIDLFEDAEDEEWKAITFTFKIKEENHERLQQLWNQLTKELSTKIDLSQNPIYLFVEPL